MNTISSEAFASTITQELDKELISSSAVGFMADENLRAKFVGAKTVKVPNIALQGLGDYDRETGFIKGTISINNQAFTLQQDRARSFMIDREDLDETGIASLAGEVMGEFIRTRVVPETEAYTISKLASLSNEKGNISYYNGQNVTEVFDTLRDEVVNKVGFDEELVCFVDSYAWKHLRLDDSFARLLNVSYSGEGEVKTEIHQIDNVTIIPMLPSRMKTAYEFYDGEENAAGGFAPMQNANSVLMLMMPKRAVSLVKKSEKIRVFTPDQNLSADAYKFDYRIYYDVFVKDSFASTIYSVVTPCLDLYTTAQETPVFSVGEGAPTLSQAAIEDATCQWFYAYNPDLSDATAIANSNSFEITLPEKILIPNTYVYIFIRVKKYNHIQDSVAGCVTFAE
jgi:hypothetical protein